MWVLTRRFLARDANSNCDVNLSRVQRISARGPYTITSSPCHLSTNDEAERWPKARGAGVGGEKLVAAWMGISVSLLVQKCQAALRSYARFLTHLSYLHLDKGRPYKHTSMFSAWLSTLL